MVMISGYPQTERGIPAANNAPCAEHNLKPNKRRPNMFDRQSNIHDKPDKTKTIQHVFVVCRFVFWI